MKLIIAEKPSVAQTIAAALGVKEKKDGYIEGGGCLISWCVGHLVQLAEAAAYGEQYKKWSFESLPILPEEWQYAVDPDKGKQFKTLKELMHRADVSEVVNACDAGREGELIFRFVYAEELKEVEAAPEAMAAALFDLLRERTHREVQPIPEDKPARRTRRMPQTGEEAESPQKGDSWQHKGDTVTLFMNGGRMIGLRPKDIAGLFYNTVEMEKGAVGDIRIFPKHSLIEVDASVAPLLLEALATATVCGYEVNVREDKGAPEYSGTPRSSRRNGGFRNSYRGERDRSDRSGFRGNRGGFRSDRGERWGERSRRDDRKKRF